MQKMRTFLSNTREENLFLASILIQLCHVPYAESKSLKHKDLYDLDSMFETFEEQNSEDQREDKLTLLHIFIFEGFSTSGVDNDLNLMFVLKQIKHDIAEIEKKD